MKVSADPLQHVEYILAPRSIAIVGASGDFSKFTGRTVKHVLKHGYRGRLYLVNPTRSSVAGLQSYRSVRDLPEPVDTAFIQVPAGAVRDVIDDCLALGAHSAILHGDAPGWRDEGLDPRGMWHLAIEKGLRLLGPNCAGIANVVAGTVLSPLACYELPNLLPGRIGVISQSGGITGAFVSRVTERGMGLSYVISTGNELDLDVCDFAEFLVADRHTSVIAIFLEALRNVAHFRRVADQALAQGKPIVVLKVGRSEAGARAAATHTGALTGRDALYDALFRQVGVVRVHTLEDLVETSALLAKGVRLEGNRVGVVTTTGGGATLMVDVAAQAGLDFPATSGPILPNAEGPLAGLGWTSNPVDVTMAGVGDVYKEALQTVVDDDAFDVVVAAVGSSSQFAPELAVVPIVEVGRAAKKPLLAFCTPNAQEALLLFEREGIAAFRTPEACGRALGYLDHYRRSLARHTQTESADQGRRVEDAAVAARQILGATSDSVLNEYASKQILEAFGLTTIPEIIVQSPTEARLAAESLGYPVAVKLVSPDVPHKTDAGVVQLGVESPERLDAAVEVILRRTQQISPAPRVEGLLIQKMAPPGFEVIIGLSCDEHFGPTLVFGLGGTHVEALQDVAVRVLPISRRDAYDMIDETRSAGIFKHHRGLGALDRDATVDALLKMAQIGEDLQGELDQVDVNPLIVHAAGKGVVAVDALVIKRRFAAITPATF